MSIVFLRKLAVAGIALVAGLPLSGQAQSAAAREAAMRQVEAAPSLTGFSPARESGKFAAPPGGHGHTMAYQDGNGCVTFFLPMQEYELLEVGMKWNGPACSGKPIEGKGTLQIYRRTNDEIVVVMLKGRFVKGALTGEGEKAIFKFDPQGKPREDSYVFHGTFARQVLHGQGVRRWVGPADEHPSAWSETGPFVDGTAHETTLYARLRAEPGLLYDAHQLRVDKDGQTYVHQAYNNGKQAVKGVMRFENDPVEWNTETMTWKHGPVDFTFSRIDQENGHALAAKCLEASYQKGHIRCQHGEIQSGRLGNMARFGDGPFQVSLPVKSDGLNFRVEGSDPIFFGAGIDAHIPMQCNRDFTSCSGDGELHIASGLSWRGRIAMRNGRLVPESADLWNRTRAYATPDGTVPGTDLRLASCSSFSGPLQCSDGEFEYPSGNRFEGGWTLKGVAFERASASAAPGYRLDGNDFDVLPEGSGTFIFSHGAWAEVQMSAGQIVGVGACDRPSIRKTFYCELENGKVAFYAAEDMAEEAPRRRLYEDGGNPQGGGRFIPIPNPKRQPYVLPGMP